MRLKLKGEIQKDVPLSHHTWMRTGGKADYLVVPHDVEDLISVMAEIESLELPYFVIGQGTNVLFSDGGFRGWVLKLGTGFEKIAISGRTVHVGAAAKLQTLVHQCSTNSLSGIEKLCGIPGSAGGAASTNAGAYGCQFADTIMCVAGLDRSGRRVSFAKEEVQFSYRKAEYPSDIVVTGIELRLAPGSSSRSLKIVEEYLEKRRERQPLDVPSAGCVFKNPAPDMPAGKIIEECGLKGRSVGAAMVSPKHANFIVNTGSASTSDILSLIELVVQEVQRQTSIRLETEVEVVR
jgi:UDP-N-acetylmuramate dehydrogenase